MELKVVCNCGQKYKFDVEPVNGRMPMTVNCPVCGTDGTVAANGILSQMYSNQPPPVPMAAAVPTAPAPPIAGTTAGSLRINRPAPIPVTSTAGPRPLASAPLPITAIRPSALAAAPKPKATAEYSLGLGILGAILGAAVGAGLMYAFFLWAEFRFPLMGTCIGAFSGIGARLLARGTDMTLGIIAGVIALVSTAATLYLMFGGLAIMYFISMAVSVFLAYRIAG
jgi:hypothetical protein